MPLPGEQHEADGKVERAYAGLEIRENIARAIYGLPPSQKAQHRAQVEEFMLAA